MATLEMKCPSCTATLTLDAGFAGLVCRCAACGALMTVPNDSQTGSKSRAKRLERPDAPSGAEAIPAASAMDPDTVKQHKTKATDTTQSAPPSDAAGDATPPRPGQHRRRGRALIMGAVILGVVALMVWTVAVLVITLGGDGTDNSENVAIEQFGYDPEVNPYTLTELNVLGLPLEDRAAVILDGSGSGRRWLALVRDAINIGLAQDSSGTAIGLVYASETGPVALSETLEPVSQITDDQLRAFHGGVTPRGVTPLTPAIEHALAWEPAHLVLITGQSLNETQLETIEAALADHASVRLDIVLVDATSDAADALAEAYGGRHLQLSLGQLRRWYQAADVPMP